jgi:ankyrin repeat protein
MAVNKEECILVEALLKRLEREEMLQMVNKPNVQHYTPLCIAVFMNNAAIAHQLIKAGANVNFQIQRHRSNGMGITYFRLVHYVACRGLKCGETLEALLKADNIDLDYFNSEGLSAVHYAINSHAKNCSQDGGTIDSRHAIYTLFCRGANLGLPDGLSGKTPLHYVVEKKNVDFLSWFLDLVRHISDKLALSSVVHNSHSYLHSIVNARTNAGLTALHIAAAVHTDRERNVCVDRDHEQNMRIVQLLLLNGAELSSHSDAKLYKDLRTKFPELAELIKNVGSGSRSNSRS